MVQNATTGALPAVVTIPDLPTGTTITGAELLEAVQTVGGVGNSIQITISQIATSALGGLPTGGGTGQVLNKLSGVNFSTQWANISSLVTASTGLAESGSTTVALSLASTAGLSVLGVAAVASAVPSALAGTAAQVLVVNDAGTGVGFGRVNLASSAAVTGVLPGGNMTAVNLAASGPGGVQGVLPVGNGGQGTSTLTAHAVLLGAGTTTLSFAAATAAGDLLVDQGASSDPAFKPLSGDATLTSTGALTIANLAVINAKLAQGPATSLIGNNTAATANRTDLNVSQVISMLGLQPRPGGRLTVTNGVPVMTASASGQTTLYYAPFANPFVPINNATSTQYYFFPANATSTTGLSLALGTNWVSNTLYDAFAIASGTTPVLATVAWSNATTRATALGLFNGLQVNNATATMRTSNTATTSVPIYQGTYLGLFLTDASNGGQITWLPGTVGTGTQQAARLSLWNTYNDVDTRAYLGDATASWTYTSTALRAANGNTSNSVTFVSGFARDAISALYLNEVTISSSIVGAFVQFGLALDTTTATSLISAFFGAESSTTATTLSAQTPITIAPQLGQHILYAWESADGTHTTTFFGGTASLGYPQMAITMMMRM